MKPTPYDEHRLRRILDDPELLEVVAEDVGHPIDAEVIWPENRIIFRGPLQAVTFPLGQFLDDLLPTTRLH